MPSSYSTRLRLELQAAGENANTWGGILNTQLGTLLEQAIAGVASIALPDANYTLTATDGAADEARNAVLVLTGTLSAPRNVVVPSVQKAYTVRNATSGGHAVTVKTAAGSGVAVGAGFTATVYCDGTNVVASGVHFNASGNGAISVGSAAFVTMPTVGGVSLIPPGVIVMWSGSVASIPAGWALCDGASGTPDLRDRFVVGAGGTRNPGTTGGAASGTTSSAGAHTHSGNTGGTALTEAQMPAHTHTGTTSTNGAHSHNLFGANSDWGNTAGLGQSGVHGVGGTFQSGGNAYYTSTAFAEPYVSTSGDHTHTFTTGSTGGGQAHSHTISSDGAHTHTVDTLPPFYALAFIMKL